VTNSQPSATPVSRPSSQQSAVSSQQPEASPTPDNSGLRAACAEAVEELRAARKLLASQGAQIEKQDELIALERKIGTGLKDLRNLDAEQKADLYKAIDAANRETSALRAEIAVLKKKQVTVWKQIKWFVIGGAAGVIAGAVLTK
jgi:hypothetical protein